MEGQKGTHFCLPLMPPGVPLAGGRSLGSPYKDKEEMTIVPTYCGDPQTTQPTCLSIGVITPPPHPRSREVQASQRTHPPSTISSTAKKSPSMFSSRARFSTFFLSPPKKKKKKKNSLCVKGILEHYLRWDPKLDQ